MTVGEIAWDALVNHTPRDWDPPDDPHPPTDQELAEFFHESAQAIIREERPIPARGVACRACGDRGVVPDSGSDTGWDLCLECEGGHR